MIRDNSNQVNQFIAIASLIVLKINLAYNPPMNSPESPLGLPQSSLQWVNLSKTLRTTQHTQLEVGTYPVVPKEGIVVYENPEVYEKRLEIISDSINRENNKALIPRMFVLEPDATIVEMSPVSLIITHKKQAEQDLNVILFCANAGASEEFYQKVKEQYVDAANNAFVQAGIEPFPPQTNAVRQRLG